MTDTLKIKAELEVIEKIFELLAPLTHNDQVRVVETLSVWLVLGEHDE